MVSIITPTYNRAYILGTALESVLAQTEPNWELVIVDDGSTDNTKDLVQSYQDNRIRYIYQENSGPSSARNNGLEEAKGEWIAYLDSDNELYPEYLETVLLQLVENPEVVFAVVKGKRTQELYQEGKLVAAIDDTGDFLDNLNLQDIGLRKHHFDTNGFIHSRRVPENNIFFDEKIRGMEDWDFILQIAEKFPEGFIYIPQELFHYHQRYGTDGLVSSSTYQNWIDNFHYIYKKHKNHPLLEGQTWYPQRVEKYKKLQEEFEQHQNTPQYLMRFQDLLRKKKQ